jgi:hypothetical protein
MTADGRLTGCAYAAGRAPGAARDACQVGPGVSFQVMADVGPKNKGGADDGVR